MDNTSVKVIKEKNGTPTVIEWNGKRYVLDNGRPNTAKKAPSK